MSDYTIFFLERVQNQGTHNYIFTLETVIYSVLLQIKNELHCAICDHVKTKKSDYDGEIRIYKFAKEISLI